MHRFTFLASLLLMAGCSPGLPDHVALSPEAENVEFAYEAPGPDAYKEVGKVTGIAQGTDTEATTAAAKNDLRNKAAALGATVVTMDQNIGEAVPLTNQVRVKVSGRAFKPVD